MKLIISHNRAADFWRKVYPAQRRPFGSASVAALDSVELASASGEVWELAPSWVTPGFLKPERGVLHVLSQSHGDHCRSKTHMVHSCEAPLPEGSLYALSDDVYVCSPEFVFLQLAQTLDLVQLIAYGFELCGSYAFDDQRERGFRKRKVSLVTLAQLTQFVESVRGMRGRKRALEALRYIQDRSASPMETVCALFLSLPYRYGGYGLPQLLLNSRIDVPYSLRALCPKGFVRADLRVPGKPFVLEYLGGYDHAGYVPMQSDRGRTVVLREMGYEVVELTSKQVWDLEAFEIIAKRVSKVFGKRIRSGELGSSNARMHLRFALRAWNDASGRSIV
ncbi:MAG: hypothetical protein J5818_04570 [Eggerthellaceae bacterium]|nr:hypothetical protein [Eggerthellaceae bacterium]